MVQIGCRVYLFGLFLVLETMYEPLASYEWENTEENWKKYYKTWMSPLFRHFCTYRLNFLS